MSTVQLQCLPAIPSESITHPLYYKTDTNEYIVNTSSTGIELFNTTNNKWSSYFNKWSKLQTQHVGNVINAENNILYIISVDAVLLATCDLTKRSKQHTLPNRTISTISSLETLYSPQCVYVSSLNELHIFGSDNIRSYHFVLNEAGTVENELIETEGVNSNEPLSNAKMIHVEWKNQLLIFGGYKYHPFQGVSYNNYIWSYELSGKSKWEIYDTEIPLRFQQRKHNFTRFDVSVAFGYIVVLYSINYGNLWFWDLIENKWYESTISLSNRYHYIVITDENMMHVMRNGDKKGHIKVKLLDIMPESLQGHVRKRCYGLVYQYVTCYFGTLMPLEIIPIILNYFEVFD